MVPIKDVGYYIKNINDRLKVWADADLKRYNLTLAQSRVFGFLHSRGGMATQKEIEVFLEVSHPTVVGIISRMEQNGHVISWMDETNRRNKLVKLTAQADQIGEQLAQDVQLNEQRMLRNLTDEEAATLKRLLKIIYKNLE